MFIIAQLFSEIMSNLKRRIMKYVIIGEQVSHGMLPD